MSLPSCQLDLGTYAPRVEERLRAWAAEDFAARLWKKDTTLWSAEPVAELADRLGWLDLAEADPEEIDRIRTFADSVDAERILLLGMGGSSLAPEVFSRLFEGERDLEVLDSTHPAAVAAATAKSRVQETLYIVSSKSGTTIETASLLDHFYSLEERRAPGEGGGRFVAITDPGTALARRAESQGFAALFEAPPEVGGRYSALSPFGLLPAALVGADLDGLLARASEMAALCRSGEPNPGLLLGAAIGELALAGRDKLTLLASPELASLPDWLEQLIAESLGKQGKGVVPIAGEGEAPPGANTEDRFFVGLSLDGGDNEAVAPRLERARAAGHPTAVLRLGERLQIGAEMLRWEIATAACGALLGVHPFDQPDVQAAKDAAQKAMRRPEETAGGVEVVAVDAAELRQRLEVFLGGLSAGDYVGVQAFLEPGPSARPVRELRSALWRRTGVAVTAGHGPRFLHSTGQLHKGGPGTGRFLQLVDRPATDVPIPGSDVTFGRLIRAQAAGDAEALAGRGRKVLVVDLGAQGPVGIQRLLDALG